MLQELPAFSYYLRLKRVKDFVEHHISERITIQRAARIAGLEEKYFSAFFRTKTGARFTEWLAHIRIARAMHLMQQQDYTITEVASAVGFQDLRTFERTFKRHTNMTPRAFKRSVQPVAGRMPDISR